MLRVESISVSFGGLRALDSVSLEVRAGQFAEKGIHSGDHVDIPASVTAP